MPECLVPTPPYVEKLKNAFDEFPFSFPHTIGRQLLKEHPDEYLGDGAESYVIVHPTNPDLVIAYVWRKTSHAKDLSSFDASILYHTHRIWSILFPHNFPRIKEAFSGKKARTLRERVRGKSIAKLGGYKCNTDYRLIQAALVCKENHLPKFRYDNFSENLMIGPDGGEYYVDLVSSRGNDIQLFNRDVLSTYMQKINLPEQQRRQVLNSAERLSFIALAKELATIKWKKKQLKIELTDTDYKQFLRDYNLDYSEEKFARNKKKVDALLNWLEKIYQHATN